MQIGCGYRKGWGHVLVLPPLFSFFPISLSATRKRKNP